MLDRIRIATRESKLALWQANFIREQLRSYHPGLEVELVGMTTKGDRWLDSPLSEVGGKGLFVKELEAAMLDGLADIAVHSMKDVPAVLPDGFIMPVMAYRGPVEDMLITRAGDLRSLPQGARIGSSSLRRQAQLLTIRPDLIVASIRGNVGTRLAKLDAGEFDAIVLARAGIERLGLDVGDAHILDVDLSLPAPGQAALGVECLVRGEVEELLEPLQDAEVSACVRSERAVSAGFGADCSLPIAAYATKLDDQITLRALVANVDGSRIVRTEKVGVNVEKLGAAVVAELFDAGAQEILDSLVD
ncbi:MAG: hydroxymethylbilane synthase [Pseudomonadales bacterium]|nr:hydroxymethylbilane synthase [Pseudomonadales bacterium]